MNIHAAAESGSGALAVIVLQLFGDLEGALCGVGFGLDVEDGAVLDPAGVIGTFVDGLLEELLVPTGDEVAVVTVAYVMLA